MTQSLHWMRANLFSSPFNGLLTCLLALLIAYVFFQCLDWALLSAVWAGQGRADCLGSEKGACWPFVAAKFDQFIYGAYPQVLQWRPDTVFVTGLILLVGLGHPRIGRKTLLLFLLFFIYPLFAFVLLKGGAFGLETVPTSQWGGLLLTLVVAVSGMIASLPLGILLALGRRADSVLIRTLSIAFIEFWRGIPLVTVLFMASVMLPLFFPAGMDVDKLLRALIGVSLFSAAYMAEVVRGGLNAIGRGQYEAGAALGLSYWRLMGFVVLPQALRFVIPGIVNSFIALFKDTTLVLIIGLFDLLGMIQFHLTDPAWATAQTATTGYVFAALIFWIFCFSMSRYAHAMERRLKRGRT